MSQVVTYHRKRRIQNGRKFPLQHKFSFNEKFTKNRPNIFSVPILCSSMDFQNRLILFGTETGQINCLNIAEKYERFSEVGAISAGEAHSRPLIALEKRIWKLKRSPNAEICRQLYFYRKYRA